MQRYDTIQHDTIRHDVTRHDIGIETDADRSVRRPLTSAAGRSGSAALRKSVGKRGLGGGRREAGRPTGRRRRGWSLWVGLAQAPVLHGVLMRREGREGTVAGRWSWRRLSGLFSFSLCTLFSFQCRCFGGLLLPSYAISTAL